MRNIHVCACQAISSYSFEVWGLKFGMKTYLFNAMKFIDKDFWIFV